MSQAVYGLLGIAVIIAVYLIIYYCARILHNEYKKRMARYCARILNNEYKKRIARK